MAAPNIVNVSALYGKSAGLALTTSDQDLLLNAANSNKVFKVNSIFVSNVTPTNVNASLYVAFYDSSALTSYEISNAVVVPPYTTLVVVDKDSSIYLEESDKITARASTNSALKVVISYEDIS